MLGRSGSPQSGLERLAQHEPGLCSGPSEASTSSSTPSTIDRARSTSPPKSACPGVSTMLIVTAAAGAVPDGRVLGEDGDALLPLEVHRVHHPFGHALVGPERRTATASGRPASSCRGRRGRRWQRCAGPRGSSREVPIKMGELRHPIGQKYSSPPSMRFPSSPENFTPEWLSHARRPCSGVRDRADRHRGRAARPALPAHPDLRRRSAEHRPRC